MRIGQTFVPGREPVMARQLLAAAASLGMPAHVVTAKDAGFEVPDAVWDYVERELNAPDPEAVF